MSDIKCIKNVNSFIDVMVLNYSDISREESLKMAIDLLNEELRECDKEGKDE